MNETKSSSRNFLGVFLGIAAGAVAMYYLDPQKGRTRRAQVSSKIYRWNHRTLHRTEKIAADFRNRIYGKFQELQHRRKAAQVDDDTLERRIRSAIGRKVSHVKSIKIFVNQGEVGLAGPILLDEVDGLIEAVENIPGVVRVYDELSKYEHPSTIPDLQGERPEYRQ